MQLCALDENEDIIFAYKAMKQKDYHCLECHALVRLRGGIHRQPHFYHSHPNRRCTLHSKGLPHLLLQYQLIKSLPSGEAEMECRFPEICRIGDIAWHAQKIVFEIQYSPISGDEILERNRAYGSQGYQVVWILHDIRFNQMALSAAEDVLIHSPHYFTNMNEFGEGVIYDQLCCIKNGIRTYRLPKVTIDPSLPYPIDQEECKNLMPNYLFQRINNWSLGFAGDTLHQFLEGNPDLSLINSLASMPREDGFGSLQYNLQRLREILNRSLIRPYKFVFQLILERASR